MSVESCTYVSLSSSFSMIILEFVFVMTSVIMSYVTVETSWIIYVSIFTTTVYVAVILGY
jgi:hypothetical protein